LLTYVVNAFWDDEARVWVAESENVPGLVTEAPTKHELLEKLRTMIPELLEANGTRLPRNSPAYVRWYHEADTPLDVTV